MDDPLALITLGFLNLTQRREVAKVIFFASLRLCVKNLR